MEKEWKRNVEKECRNGKAYATVLHTPVVLALILNAAICLWTKSTSVISELASDNESSDLPVSASDIILIYLPTSKYFVCFKQYVFNLKTNIYFFFFFNLLPLLLMLKATAGIKTTIKHAVASFISDTGILVTVHLLSVICMICLKLFSYNLNTIFCIVILIQLKENN